jgi:hypothetical protein
LEELLNENSELQPKDKTNQTILLTLRNLVYEITKVKNEDIMDDYNKWIKDNNINNEKYIFNWISESLNRIKIKNNLIGHTENAENKEDAMLKIEEAQKALEDAWNPVIQKIYAEQNPQGAQGANPFGGTGSNPFGNMFNGAQTQQ